MPSTSYMFTIGVMAPTSLPQITLDGYLRRPNPELTVLPKGKNGKGGTTRSSNWDCPTKVRMWDDFSLEAFDKIYHKPLQKILDELKTVDSPTILTRNDTEIHDHDTLEFLLSKSVHTTVSQALDIVQASLKIGDGAICVSNPISFPLPHF